MILLLFYRFWLQLFLYLLMSRGSSSSEESDSSGDTFAPEVMLEALKSEGRIWRNKTKLETIRIVHSLVNFGYHQMS